MTLYCPPGPSLAALLLPWTSRRALFMLSQLRLQLLQLLLLVVLLAMPDVTTVLPPVLHFGPPTRQYQGSGNTLAGGRAKQPQLAVWETVEGKRCLARGKHHCRPITTT